MASEPVRSTTVVAAPKDYSVPPAQQIRLLSVRASFDGTGAGGAFLPALQILDNNGNVLVTAADPGVSVAAGASADVSWFPGVKKAAAASTGGGISYARGYSNHVSGDPNIVVPTSGQIAAPFAHVSTSNAAVLSWTTTTNPNDTLQILANGITVLNASWQDGLGGGIVTGIIYVLQGTEVPNKSWDNLDTVSTGDPSGNPTALDYAIVSSVGGARNVQLLLQNGPNPNQNVGLAALGAIFLGNPA